MRRFDIAFLAGCLLLVTYFHQGPGFNANGRLLTVFGVVEHHRLAGDEWKNSTKDYAEIGGHIYSDKAPMASLLTLPFYALYRLPSHTHLTDQDKDVAYHIGMMLAGAIPFALVALLCLYRVRRNGVGPYAAVALALAATFGTSMANYGACFFGHMLAAAFFLGAYVLAIDQERYWALAGFLGGCAVLTEYPVVITQFIICIYLLTGPDRWRRTVTYCLGALPMAIAMVVYNKLITGGFFDFPYNHVDEMWAAMRTDFGMRLPSLEAAWELVFGQYRGLACYCPTLLLLVPLIWGQFDGPHRRRNLTVILMAANLVLIASYFKWDGGWATGPRHLMPLVALGTYEGLGALTKAKRGYGWFALLALWGIVVSTTASATDPLPGEGAQHPVFEVFFRKVAARDFASHTWLKELFHLPNGYYLLVGWAVLFIGMCLGLGWYLARTTGVVLTSEQLRRSRRFSLGAAATAALLLLAVLIRHATAPVDLLQLGGTWRASSGFAPDRWPTTGSTADRGPYQLMFHTEEQDNPWVILDLHATRSIHRIDVANREDCCKDRAVPLLVEASTDQKTWAPVAKKEDVFDEWSATFPPRDARYLRLSVAKKTLLHLRDVQVF